MKLIKLLGLKSDEGLFESLGFKGFKLNFLILDCSVIRSLFYFLILGMLQFCFFCFLILGMLQSFLGWGTGWQYLLTFKLGD